MKNSPFRGGYKKSLLLFLLLFLPLPAHAATPDGTRRTKSNAGRRASKKRVPPRAGATPEELRRRFERAVMDAATPEPDEISRNLTAIVASNKRLRWMDDEGRRRVLLVTWTSWAGYDERVGQLTEPLAQPVWATVVP
ncbi:MAG TPA: hypothetical protein VJT82_10155, partial [Pyrinomonadaceae bacterium]|nr:hypothetical protein [Pyrinomonadaceae bacterium]